MKTGLYYRLNRVAANALRHLEAGPTVVQLAERLIDEFEVDRSTLTADLGELLLTLERHGLALREV